MAHADRITVDIGNTFAKLHRDQGATTPWEFEAPLHLETRALAEGHWQPHQLSRWLESQGVRSGAGWVVASVHESAERALAEWVGTIRTGDSYRRLS